MASRNPNFLEIQSGYLFVELAERKRQYLQDNPSAKLISLGIGDTTEPLPAVVVEGIGKKLCELSHVETYTGYPPYNGDQTLRERIAAEMYLGRIKADEIFISDGSKPDLGRLQFLFADTCSVAVQDPVYPVYVDSAVMSGKAGKFIVGSKGRYSQVEYMPCFEENDFFPNLEKLRRTDLIYFCSPNNPTGACATREQLVMLVEFARKNKSIILFDSAYREFIVDSHIPKSIFEIPGAHEVAMETCSFSKMVGFTGVRLGWTVCPKALNFGCGNPVWNDWSRIMGTMFNGPSNLAEAGGLSTLTTAGLEGMRSLISYYRDNVNIIRGVLEAANIHVYGGSNSPYLWVKVPPSFEELAVDGPAGNGRVKAAGPSCSTAKSKGLSWTMFQELLEKCSILCTPGVGFGDRGEGYIRLSMFAHREDVQEAALRLEGYFEKRGKFDKY